MTKHYVSARRIGRRPGTGSVSRCGNHWYIYEPQRKGERSPKKIPGFWLNKGAAEKALDAWIAQHRSSDERESR